MSLDTVKSINTYKQCTYHKYKYQDWLNTVQIEYNDILLANESLEHMVISVQDSVWQSSAYLLDKIP